MIIICDRRFAPGNLVYIRENSKDDLLDMFIPNQRMRIRNCICYDTHLRISSDTCVTLLQYWNKERCTSSCSPKISSNGSNVQRLSFRENSGGGLAFQTRSGQHLRHGWPGLLLCGRLHGFYGALAGLCKKFSPVNIEKDVGHTHDFYRNMS